MASIFLSYSKKDRDFARRLARDIAKRGHRVWLDDAEIRVGDSLIDKIRDGIDRVDFLGVVLSGASVNSEWVRVEVEIAMTQQVAGRRVKVLPLLLEEVEVPSYLAGKRYADFRDQSAYSIGLKGIIGRLNEHSKTVPSSRPRLATSFWEFSHIQSAEPDLVNDIGGAEGSSWFEFEILRCSKSKLRTHAIEEWRPLRQLISLISPTLAVLCGKDTRDMEFGLVETVQWEPTDFWPWLHRHHIAAYGSAPKNRPYDGFNLEIKRTRAVFQPWRGGNTVEEPDKDEFDQFVSVLEKPLQRLVAELTETDISQLRFGRMQRFDDLPAEGGFGYVCGWSQVV